MAQLTNKTDLISALRLFRRYNLIEITGDLNTLSSKIVILPTILLALKSEDITDIKLNILIVYDEADFEGKTEEEILKYFKDEVIKINRNLPKYKTILGISITKEPLIKTTTGKIKRDDNLAKFINK